MKIKPKYSGTTNKKRLVFLLYFTAFFFLCLILRIGYLVFIKGEWLASKAENQWTRDTIVVAERGSILDRSGATLAISASVDTVVLHPNSIEDANAVADQLSVILDMDRATVYEKATDTSMQEVWLKRQVDRETANEIRALELKGVDFVSDVKRYYPNNDFLTQVLGFTSVDGEGLEGLELKYNKYLSGQNGRVVTETDKNGVTLPFGKEVYVEAENGYDIYLTIDEVIQSYLEQAVKEALSENNAASACGVVMDPNTGEILALANAPTYDLNEVPRDDLDQLAELSRNRVVTDVYEPGSTFKIITTAAALDSKAVTKDSTFYCAGYKIVDGEKIKCWRTIPHGTQNLTQAVMNSCNPCFMEMALRMGSKTFYNYIKAFGFGSKTGINLTGEQSGILMNLKYVKNVDLARMGFGQAIAITPIQMITAASAAINGGKLMTPYIVEKYVNEEGETVKQFEPTVVRQVVSPEVSATMRELLEMVVKEGTGKNGGVAGYRVGGKTGTAQKYDENGVIMTNKHISSFIGFAPADDPQLIVLIIVDEADVAVDFGSIVAAPYVSEVLGNSLKHLNIQPTEPVETVKVTIPDVRGLSLSEAQTKLEAAGLNYLSDGTGNVAKQSIAPNERVDKGTTVLLYMQTKTVYDENVVQVPNVKGMNIVDAKRVLAAVGLILEAKGSGNAVKQSLAANTYVAIGSTVTVTFEKE